MANKAPQQSQSTTSLSSDDPKLGLVQSEQEEEIKEPKSIPAYAAAIVGKLLCSIGAPAAIMIVLVCGTLYYMSERYGIPLRDSHTKAQERISQATEDMAKATASQAETLKSITQSETLQLKIQEEQNRQLTQILDAQDKSLDNHRIIIQNQAEFGRDHKEQIRVMEKIDGHLWPPKNGS